MAKYRNTLSEIPVIPERVISPPSAELRPDQTDQDSLPAYDILDAILYAISKKILAKQILLQKAMKLKWSKKVIHLVDRNEYKRRQVRLDHVLAHVHSVVNDATLSSMDGQRMTEKIVSEKSQLLAQALMLEQVAFYKNQHNTTFC